ncbi:DUF1754-domain-containing protein [Amniculicola lignicola CBS 123094]|uniref:DUF1754-domain-containing protein n=1 Tax=Amniculicola lignicola CBS 123094 TaxID=1392246 RepID=A0A6A5WUT0_9PLEO|nr:DUF1754-domain-containing protein [Amniculicola lignicola CBS 123094]
MPSEYSASSGGALKLKGGAITKPKKKKKTKPTEPTPNTTTSTAPSATADTDTNTTAAPSHSRSKSPPIPTRSLSPSDAERDLKASGGRIKTEAEKRYEERRRKRLDDRLKRDGVKTHKERVEELNRYLSGLSEHHDMPKIGPG